MFDWLWPRTAVDSHIEPDKRNLFIPGPGAIGKIEFHTAAGEK